jgi:undecaprenyl-diphosphatase
MDGMALNLKTALFIGLFQCLSLVPGVSRSGSTIVGSMLLGVERKAAAEFSFFMAIPIMVGAFALDLLKSYKDIDPSHAGTIAIGFVVSFLSGLVVVKTMIGFIGKRGFTPFAWWRIVVGVVGLGLIYIPR